MSTPKRRRQSSLIRRLIDHPHQFQFFQAVRVIELWLRRGTASHGRTLDTALRFKNSVSLSFPTSAIEALSIDAAVAGPGDGALQSALEQGQLGHVHITPAFMGYLGVNGVLPYDYTDTIAEQVYDGKDESGRAFFDSFSHRFMTLFYRAWQVCRVEQWTDDKGRDGFLAVQLALAGQHATRAGRVAPAPVRDDGVIADEIVARYASLIRHRPMPAGMIPAVLTDYFGVPFRLEPFVGTWEPLPRSEQTSLGGQNNLLGIDATLGERYWRCDLLARLWVGPLSRTQFDYFLPVASGGAALKAMLAMFAVPNVRYQVCLVLRAADIQGVSLDARSRLGYGAFLVAEPVTLDDAQTRYELVF